MKNGSYILNSNIDYGNTFASPSTPEKPSVPDRIVYGNNFSVEYGYDNIPAKEYFAFISDSSAVIFGDITPGEPVVRDTSFTIIPAGATGFQLMAFENHTLQDKSKNSIPDTSCDNGNCTTTLADTWVNPLTYGFGYRCNSQACSSSFEVASNFRRFANIELGEEATTLASEISSSKTQVEILYKLNISGSQPRGVYQNTIQYITAPTY